MKLIVCLFAFVLAGLAFVDAAHADVTSADLAGQPAIMKTDCRNRLGKAGESLCTTDAAYQACATYLKQGHWDYCVHAGVAHSQMRRWNPGIAADVDKKLLANHCMPDINNSLECADEDFNLAHGFADCIAYHNAGMPKSCKERKFLPEFAQRVSDAMHGKSVGWAFTVIDRAGQMEERAEGPARRAPDTNPAKISPASHYEVASVSKNITGAATVRALANRGISLDAHVSDYLPGDWAVPAGFKTITFRQLMRHRSGLRCTNTQNVDYGGLKACVEAWTGGRENLSCTGGILTDTAGIGCYQNTDYGLLRLAIPAVLGQQPSLSLNANDRANRYAYVYIKYVNDEVFKPAGFTASCHPTDGAAQPLTYVRSPVKAGGDFGDMDLLCGSEGWFLSSHQLAQYLRARDEPGLVLPWSQLDVMRDNLIGFEGTAEQDTSFGAVRRWWHDGFHPGSMNPGEIHTMALSFSNGVHLAIIVNSDMEPGFDWGGAVTAAFFDTMKP